MLFNFTTFNHCHQGQVILEDVTKIMGGQLEALGHGAAYQNAGFVGPDDGWNVVIESFADDPRTIETIAGAHAMGCKFIYVGTEEPTPSGFNHGLEPAMIDRQNAFAPAARYCDGILALMPGEHVTRWYSNFAPTAHAELGYTPGLVGAPDIEPDIDFGFYGKMSWRRDQILRTLEAMTGTEITKITTLDVPREERDAAMRRARVIIQVRANEEWGLLSNTRCATALMMGRPVVAEPHRDRGAWDGVIHFSDTIESFYLDAMATARAWRDVHAAQVARFKETLTPQFCIGDPLRRIGIIP
jgi:hypothetical protein